MICFILWILRCHSENPGKKLSPSKYKRPPPSRRRPQMFDFSEYSAYVSWFFGVGEGLGGSMGQISLLWNQCFMLRNRFSIPKT